MAGSIAYSAFVSLLPLLLLALVVASAVGGQAFADQVVQLTREYLSPTAQGLLTDALLRASEQVTLSFFGLMVLLWSVLKVFRGLDIAFSTLYHTPGQNGILDQIRDGVTVLAGISVAVAAMVGAGALVAFLPTIPYVGLLSFVLLVLALAVVFIPIYYVFPDVDVSIGDVLPGTVVAATGWALLQWLFQLYVRFSSTSELYGAIGGVILLVVWLYFGAQILLIGAAVNVVLSGRSEAAQPPPNPEGTRAPE